MGNDTMMNFSSVSEDRNLVNVENNSSEMDSSNNKTDIVQKIKTNLFRQERDRLWKAIKQVRQATELSDFLQKTTTVIHQELKADRVILYRFENNNHGQVVTESVGLGWTPAKDTFLPCEAFGGQKASDYQVQGFVAIESAAASQLTPHQQQLMAKLQVQASLALPIMLDGYASDTRNYGLSEVWGLLIVQQCSQDRQWQEDEINLLYQLTLELTRVLQPSLSRLPSTQQTDLLTAIEREMQQSMQKLLNQIRYSLKADRALIYGFNPDSSGEILAESVDSQWQKAGNSFDRDCFLTAENCQSQYIVNDIYKQNFASCLIEAYEAMDAKAYIAIPIKIGDRLLGMLVVYQNSASRVWTSADTELTTKYAAKFNSYLEQTALIRHPQFQAKQVEKFARQDALSVIETEAEQFIQRMLHQIRQLVRADRTLVYCFNPDGSGAVLAESVDSQWQKAGNSFDRDCFLTAENCQSQYIVNDIYKQNYASCLIEAYEAMNAKAYIAIPIKFGDRLLGMLSVFQNSGSRNWQESEVELMVNYAVKFSAPLQQTSLIRVARFQAKQLEKTDDRDFLTSINQEAQQEIQKLLDKIRQSMKLDRTVIYSFNADWSGEVLAESHGSNWHQMGSVLDKDFHFKNGEFEPYYIANDVQSKGLARAVLEKFEQMQARAYIVVPIHVNNQLLGLLGVYQNSGPRNWQESEVMQVREYTTRFIKPLQQTSFWRNSQFQNKQMEESFKRERSLAKILEKLRLSKDEQAVLQIATSEGRKILDVDRVAIYRFNDDWSGNFIAESAAPGWSNLIEIIPFIEDTFLQNTKGGRYKNGESFTVEDIYLAGHKECHIELLEQMEARAYVLAPIFIADSNMFGSKKLWGLIGIYQNTGARRWQSYEVDATRQLGLQVGIALQQISYLNRIEKQAEQEKASNRIIEKIRRAENIDEIFKVATNEVRQSYKADRTVVYQFNPDWTGQVVAESVGSGWVSLLVEQNNSEMLSGNRTKSDRCILKKWSVDDITETDTYLERTRGGKYSGEKGKKFTVVNDIYAKKFPDCYVASLEKYEVRAYIIAPIFQERKLWGLLGVYQNSGPRNWEESETKQMVQIANQLAVAIQQADYVEKLTQQTEQLEQTIQRERSAKEELQKQAVDMLRTVRPAFSGDLTVRANVTENEIGTIAGAYNTTLDSLREIVVQVKATVETVADTTGVSSVAMEGLSMKAQRQLQELELALEQIQATIKTSTTTTQNAQKVESAIQQADLTVQNGDRAMNKTVESILSIRETVADAGKRVKRLSDSSQKISRVVNLISSFAAQTNLLALNAALEATRAGEYGKGFAVVADEVRNLSLQSSEATTEIEKLVRDIQEETQEVAAAMETGVQQVAEGTSLVNETRDSLNEIVSSTREIRELVKDISLAADAQTRQAESVTRVVGQVAEIANETSEDSQRISGSFQELETLAQNLQNSISRFKVK
jgi:methyl-accepting chemotaxis protein PixJ